MLPNGDEMKTELEEMRESALDALLWLMDNSKKTKEDEIPTNLGNDVLRYINTMAEMVNK